MSVLSKRTKLICIIALLIAFIVSVVWTALSFFPPNKVKTERYMQRDKYDLTIVADYLKELDYPYITIDKSDIESGQMFTGANTGYQKIDNKTVIKSLKRLLKSRKYKAIGKNDNTIFFEKWRFLEKDRGIAVVIDKEKPIFVEFLIKSEPLSETGWYYYEADYEKYRNQ